MQKEQFFQHAMKDTLAAANRMAATDRVRYETSQYHDHRVVLGVFDRRLLEELVFCVCLLRGAASHKKRLPTRFASSSVIQLQ